ncbi:MAG: hypothetical protein PHF70_06730 [Opitutales bacterium]|nr:hypothetical protein [Opitutales bacterium]
MDSPLRSSIRHWMRPLRNGLRAYGALMLIHALAWGIDPESVLRSFEGHWIGSYTSESISGETLGGGKIEVVASYLDGILWLDTTYTENNRERKEFGWTKWEDNRFRNAVERDGKTFLFSGWISGNTLRWLPDDPKARMNQLHSEQVVSIDGSRRLVYRGFEMVPLPTGVRFVLFDAELQPFGPLVKPAF